MFNEFSDIFDIMIYKDFCTQKFGSNGFKGVLGRIIYPILVFFGFLTGFVLVGTFMYGGFVFVGWYSLIKEIIDPSIGGYAVP